MPIKPLLNYLGIITLVIVVFSSGFYFGYKNSESKKLSTFNGISNQSAKISTIDSPSSSQSSSVLPVTEVFWIKPDADRVCPPEYPVKGTFQPDLGNYYTKDNSRYDRVKPDICFVTEDFAQKKAGFIKKF